MFGYIYETTNLINGKKYIGQKTSSIFLGNKYLGSGKGICNAINKYGKENFSVKLLEECYSKQELDFKEMYYIKLNNAVKSDNYYNISKGGEHWNLPSEYISQNNKKHQSKKMKGRIYVHKGYDEERFIFPNQLEEYIQKGYLRGRCQKSKDIISKRTKEKMSKIKFTDEQRYKMGASNRGKHLSDKTRKKMSDYWKGKSKPWVRLPKSIETRKKMSEAAKYRLRDSKGHFVKNGDDKDVKENKIN